MAKKNIEVWSDYDKQSIWTLHIKKARGKLTLFIVAGAILIPLVILAILEGE